MWFLSLEARVKLSMYKDDNGTSLQAYVDTLVEKIVSHSNLTGFVVICDLEKARKGENDGIHLVSTLGEGGLIVQVPDILRIIARQMERNPFQYAGAQKLHQEEN